MAGDFYSIGNLAFYDGWSPDYVYFKSLLKAGVVYNSKNSGWWDAAEANAVATRAKADAETFANLKGLSKEEMDNHFLNQINDIIAFLELAYQNELTSEIRWVKEKISTMNELFTKDMQKIPEIAEMINMIQNVQSGFEYDKFNSLINIIMHGVADAQIISKHEAARIQEIKDTTRKLIKSRRNQTRGVLYSKGKTAEEQEEGAVNSALRLWNKISQEYKTVGHLNRQKTVKVKDKNGNIVEKKKYVLFGGKKFDNIQKTVDSTITDWAYRMITEVVKDADVISQISTLLSANFPTLVQGNFKLLEDDIRSIIIITIIRYARQNLSVILNNKIDDAIIKELEQELLNNASLFDSTRKLDIMGLNESNYGQQIRRAALVEQMKNLEEMANNRHGGLELFSYVEDLIATTKKGEQDKTILYQVLNNPNAANSRNWAYINDVITLIHAIEKVKQESEKMLEEWNKTAKKQQQNLTKEVKLSANAKTSITIEIENGVVKINQAEVRQALRENPTFQKMGYKKFNANSLRYTIVQLKRKASLDLKKDIINSIKAGVSHLSESDIIANLQTELQDIQIKIKADSVAELLDTIALRLTTKKGIIDPNGSIKGKNDNVAIELNFRGIFAKIHSEIAPRLTEKTKQSVLKYEKIIQEHQLRFLKTYQEAIDKEVIAVNTGSKKDADDRSSQIARKVFLDLSNLDEDQQQAYNKLDSAVTKYLDFLNEKLGLSREKYYQYEQILKKVIGHSFYVSTTVKKYDTYMNQIGFLGGSLGGNLDQQLFNIADIFKNANTPIDPDDLKWIRSAIINCFPGSIVGEKNKNLIEQYLGSLMAFALFDEGGAESAIISGFYNQYFKTMNSPNATKGILHLYRTNTIYVPGSLILKRTLDALKNQVVPAINKIPNIMTRGAGITIINKTTEKVIPNRPIYSLYGPPVHGWSVAGQKASEKVTLQILFLAGLLDIANGINKTLANIEMPT